LKKKREEENVVDIREKVVIATKVFFPYGNDVNQRGLSRAGILNAVTASLQRLQTDYIDLYIAHSFDLLTPIEETIRTFNQLIHDGKIRYWGVSNWPAVRIVQAVERCSKYGWIPPCNAQMQYSLLFRDIETDLIDVCAEYGISITAWSPLASGWLTGKVTRTTKTKDSERAQFFSKFGFINEERAYDIIDKLIEVSSSINKSPSEVAIRFLIDYNTKAQIIPIIGGAKLDHISQGMDTEKFTLQKEHIDAIHEVSKRPIPYPNSMVAFGSSSRKVDINNQ